MKICYFCLFALLFASCSSQNNKQNAEEQDTNMNRMSSVSEKNPVDTIILRKKTFNKQLNSNGKLKSVEKCDLKFKTSGQIIGLPIRNGQQVVQGDILAQMDTRDAKRDLSNALLSKEKAALDMKDYLIGQGYKADSLSFVPAELWRFAEIRSGYASALQEIDRAETNIEAGTIRAPFSGKIANLETKINEYPAADKLCTLINDNEFEVNFTVLETEIATVKVGDPAKIASFNDPSNTSMGVVTEINPMVDEKGQITIKAKIKNNGMLMDGMNVKVFIEKPIAGQLVVPKSAVVIRDNLEVVFLYSDEGKAMWTYVNILMSNSDSFVIAPNETRSSELKEGDVVVTKGNLNLADGSEMEIMQK